MQQDIPPPVLFIEIKGLPQEYRGKNEDDDQRHKTDRQLYRKPVPEKDRKQSQQKRHQPYGCQRPIRARQTGYCRAQQYNPDGVSCQPPVPKRNSQVSHPLRWWRLFRVPRSIEAFGQKPALNGPVKELTHFMTTDDARDGYKDRSERRHIQVQQLHRFGSHAAPSQGAGAGRPPPPPAGRGGGPGPPPLSPA